MVYILSSEDSSAAAMKLSELQKKCGPDAVRVDLDASQDTFEELLMELDAFSLFDERKFIVVRNCSFLSARNTSGYDAQALLKRLPTDHTLVLWVNGKADRRKKIVKDYLKQATLVEAKGLTAKTQKDFVSAQARARGLKLDWDAKEYICSHAGLDPLVLCSELDKLAVFSDHIDLEVARALVSVEPVDDIFKMTDALFERNGLRLLALYRNFRQQNMEPMVILAILAGQVRFLFQVRVLMDRKAGQQEIAQTLQAHPYRVQVSMQRASQFSADELLTQLSVLAGLDQQMKLGLLDKDLGFEEFIFSMIEPDLHPLVQTADV